MVLLDFIINTRDDVVLLVEKGIIVNKLGSNKTVATMVNKLGLEIEQKRSCYQELAQQLNGYYNTMTTIAIVIWYPCEQNIFVIFGEALPLL